MEQRRVSWYSKLMGYLFGGHASKKEQSSIYIPLQNLKHFGIHIQKRGGRYYISREQLEIYRAELRNCLYLIEEKSRILDREVERMKRYSFNWTPNAS